MGKFLGQSVFTKVKVGPEGRISSTEKVFPKRSAIFEHIY